jgi:Protein of unknown function (DUF3095)
MEMRVGLVSMREVNSAKLPIEVAKFTVASTKSIALIRGGGLSWAEGKIKGEPDRYCITDDASGSLGQLQGLSCRWQPLNSQKGSIVSLLVRSQDNNNKVFREILTKLDELLGGQVQMANPVSQQSMKYKTLWQTLKSDWKQVGTLFDKKSLARIRDSFIANMAFKTRVLKLENLKNYEAQIPSHSDYRKFDDMLRMVIDCTPKQVKALRAYLEQLYREKKIYFGLHESSHALMTCLVGNLSEGGHIHFIDGGDGGYAIAAKYLKEQMAQSPQALATPLH